MFYLFSLVHKGSGRSYHTEYRPPKTPMTDDITGEPLERRPDDNPNILKTRLAKYHKETQPVVEFYKQKVARSVFLSYALTMQQGLHTAVQAACPADVVWGVIQRTFNRCLGAGRPVDASQPATGATHAHHLHPHTHVHAPAAPAAASASH